MQRGLLSPNGWGGGLLGLGGAWQQTTCLHYVRQEHKEGLIGTENFADQHEPQHGGIRLITMGTRRMHANAPLCRTPLTSTMVRVRSPHLADRRVPRSPPDACTLLRPHGERVWVRVCGAQQKKRRQTFTRAQRQGSACASASGATARLGIAQARMNRAHNRNPKEQCQVNFRGSRIPRGILKQCQVDRSMDHGTSKHQYVPMLAT